MSLPADTEGVSGHRPKRRFSVVSILTTVLVVLAVVALILQILPANYYLLMPGEALQVEPMIKIPGYPQRSHQGSLYLTDVTVYKVDHVLEELYGRVNPEADLEPAQAVAGGLSFKQYLQYNAQLMNDSTKKAEVAALTVARGYHIHFLAGGPEVTLLAPGFPAERVLRQQDIIRSVDGHRVRTANQLSPLIRRKRPGSVVHLTVLRHGRTLHFNIRTIATKNDVPDKHGKTALIGVAVQDQLAPLPVKISIRHGSIVGPSAGLMYTLGIVQRLEHRDITHGCKVAGTGTMDYNGGVGPIGGAKQKIIAARGVGAKIFLVPNVPDNVNPARSARGSVTVVPVTSLRQALKYLNRLKPCSPSR
jgi:Lon-like protease